MPDSTPKTEQLKYIPIKNNYFNASFDAYASKSAYCLYVDMLIVKN